MGWFDFLRTPAQPVVETLEIPLFPLNTVLFPGGRVPLRVFEQRYLDMCAACMKNETPFGICLIEQGGETGQAATPYPVGTLAGIGSWDMEQLGILSITAVGSRRFRILSSYSDSSHLVHARVELFPHMPAVAIPAERQRLLPLITQIVEDQGETRVPLPHHFDDADWVGFRMSEILPIQSLAKQKLLELDDPLARLEILERYLDQRKLLG